MDQLKVTNGKITDAGGNPIQLKGTCVGGWMNMENFINGYPGSEHLLRETAVEELGKEKAEFLFDRWLDYFLADDDFAFLKSLGVNTVRLPVNYRHFERDDKPFEYIEKGFARLDNALASCEKHGLYVILDLHAVQGWQSCDWHCDNAHPISLFWDQTQYQDRWVALWREFAKRYKNRSVIAGYNVMNEPATGYPNGRIGKPYINRWDIINRVYRRVVTAIREIDADHIIFLEGDNFSVDFSGFDAPFAENLVYSSHNYTSVGFGPGPYPKTVNEVTYDRAWHDKILLEHEGYQFATKHNVPLWSGEFGSVYNVPSDEVQFRAAALNDELDSFNQHGVHWTTWTYKDVGVMGWVMTSPDCEYLKLMERMQKAKADIGTDLWTIWMPMPEFKKNVSELGKDLARLIGDDIYGENELVSGMKQHITDCYSGIVMQKLWTSTFKDMTETQIDKALQSFAFKNCVKNDILLNVVTKHLE